ncbi:MAG: GAF domain-containing protein [Bernardetiaceae bacterium]|nr:GAF domain-containing protein [Bernardetiaceae bacterium]
MKRFLKPSIIITLGIFTYIGGTLAVAYLFYVLPNKLKTSLGADSASTAQDWYAFTLPIMFTAIITLLFGLVIQVVLFTRWRNDKNKGEVRYIERYMSRVEKKEDQTDINQDDEIALKQEFEKIKKTLIEQVANAPDLQAKLNLTISKLCKHTESSVGAFFVADYSHDIPKIDLKAHYAYPIPESQTLSFEFGEGIAGEVARRGIPKIIDAIPNGYVKILSGLGESEPRNLLAMPIKDSQDNNKVLAVIEMASFTKYKREDLMLCESVVETLKPFFKA